MVKWKERGRLLGCLHRLREGNGGWRKRVLVKGVRGASKRKGRWGKEEMWKQVDKSDCSHRSRHVQRPCREIGLRRLWTKTVERMETSGTRRCDAQGKRGGGRETDPRENCQASYCTCWGSAMGSAATCNGPSFERIEAENRRFTACALAQRERRTSARAGTVQSRSQNMMKELWQRAASRLVRGRSAEVRPGPRVQAIARGLARTRQDPCELLDTCRPVNRLIASADRGASRWRPRKGCRGAETFDHDRGEPGPHYTRAAGMCGTS